jgi:hypothetical protein
VRKCYRYRYFVKTFIINSFTRYPQWGPISILIFGEYITSYDIVYIEFEVQLALHDNKMHDISQRLLTTMPYIYSHA